MTNLTKNVGTVTLTGTAEKVTLPASYGWVWVKNMSEGDIFAGLSEDISEGADGVMVIPSGECGRIQTDGFLSVYLLGSGNVQIVGQNYADCPFKAAAKGGGSGGSGQGLVLLKHEELAYTSTSSYTFLVDDFSISDYKMFVCIIDRIGSVAFTPEMSAVKFRGDGDNIYQVQWLRDNMFEIKSISETVLSYFAYQLFGVRG